MSDNKSTVEYRQVSGYPSYLVGDDGTVWRRMAPRRLRSGYARVNLFVGGPRQKSPQPRRKSLDWCVHRLVLETFVGPRPQGMVCRHLDGDPNNNALSNLCWGTYRENSEDKLRHGRSNRGSQHARAKLTEEQVRSIRAEVTPARGSQAALARKYGVSIMTINNVVHRRSWAHLQ